VLTPQLQQAIKLLQLSNLELEAVIAEELAKNPLLEARPGEDERRQPAAERRDRTRDREAARRRRSRRATI
jgi:RNA polymerase sigma-54 factor